MVADVEQAAVRLPLVHQVQVVVEACPVRVQEPGEHDVAADREVTDRAAELLRVEVGEAVDQDLDEVDVPRVAQLAGHLKGVRRGHIDTDQHQRSFSLA